VFILDVVIVVEAVANFTLVEVVVVAVVVVVVVVVVAAETTTAFIVDRHVFGGGSGVVGSERTTEVEVVQSTSTIGRTSTLPPVAGDGRRVPFCTVAARLLALGGDADAAR